MKPRNTHADGYSDNSIAQQNSISKRLIEYSQKIMESNIYGIFIRANIIYSMIINHWPIIMEFFIVYSYQIMRLYQFLNRYKRINSHLFTFFPITEIFILFSEALQLH
jgi:hypothetical protein